MGPTERSRSRPKVAFVVALTLLLPAAALISGTDALLPIASLPAILLLPALVLGQRRRPPSGPTESDEGSGGDGGSPRPERPKGLPGGGLPLLHAKQSSRRYRGTARTTLVPSRERRPAREPAQPRVPARVS
jgi:hypothetical protein